MMKNLQKGKTKFGQGVALTPEQYQGLNELAFREGHLNRSRVMQRLLNEELERKFGEKWVERYTHKTNQEAEVA